MPSNQYDYPPNDESADDLLAELEAMDWAQPESINEAAELLEELQREPDEFAMGWSLIPTERQAAVADILNENSERRTLTYDEPIDGANRERLQESLNYLLEREELGLAFRLEQNVMASQRLESFREAFPGEPLTYGDLENGAHETFLELAGGDFATRTIWRPGQTLADAVTSFVMWANNSGERTFVNGTKKTNCSMV